ncbi:alpha/beta fold hydrolase [Actinocrispum sp. NPDC049592]|uniref:alpha/beta fold hydrolase n=1 Tax=Actinocrispum sp. NPDC049592 TaxID=3154835 RepID=UPI003418F8B2
MERIGTFRSPAAKARYHLVYQELLDRCPKPAEQHDIQTGYGTTRVYRWGPGDAPPIVLLSGMAATSGSWHEVIPGLSKHNPVYAIDTLGEPGLSVQTAPLKDQNDRARWLDQVLEGLDLTNVHLLGASAGGYSAANQAFRAPQRLATVTLFDATLVVTQFRPIVLLSVVLLMTVRSKWLWRQVLKLWMGSAEVPEIIMTGIETYKAKLPPALRPGENEIRSIKLPVLAIFASRSVVHNAAKGAERARNWLRNGEVELWDMPHDLTDPDRFTQRVLDFVAVHS